MNCLRPLGRRGVRRAGPGAEPGRGGAGRAPGPEGRPAERARQRLPPWGLRGAAGGLPPSLPATVTRPAEGRGAERPGLGRDRAGTEPRPSPGSGRHRRALSEEPGGGRGERAAVSVRAVVSGLWCQGRGCGVRGARSPCPAAPG